VCAHDCMGGACESGKCKPFRVALEPQRVHGVFADERRVVWRTMGDGGATWELRAKRWEAASPTRLAGGENVEHPMRFAGDFVYWCDEIGVERVNAGGAGVEVFAATKGECTSLLVDEREAFWCTGEGVVEAKPLVGGVVRRVVGLSPSCELRAFVRESLFAWN